MHRLATAERSPTAVLIRSLIELDARPHLYLREGCASLFVYCTRVLHLSEGATYNSIEVARTARRFPGMLQVLEEGSVTLTLAPHLTEANHREVLGAAHHKSKGEVERLVASLRRDSVTVVPWFKVVFVGMYQVCFGIRHSLGSPEPLLVQSSHDSRVPRKQRRAADALFC